MGVDSGYRAKRMALRCRIVHCVCRTKYRKDWCMILGREAFFNALKCIT